MDHSRGQFRAQLFDEFMHQLLQRVFSDATVHPHIVAIAAEDGKPARVNLDFGIISPDGQAILVETKAPYSSNAAYGVNRAIRHLKNVVERIKRDRLKTVLLALAAELPQGSRDEVENARRFIESMGVGFEVWDATVISRLAQEHLGAAISEYSIEELQAALERTSVTVHNEPRPELEPRSHLPTGSRDGVVVLSADFCSFSRFVHASGDDAELVTSVMGRFYREVRSAIADFGGVLDEYMGDGVLAYWFGVDSAKQMEECVQRLIGISLNLSEEWQDQIDLAVEPKGLRAGAAVGAVLFIPEDETSGIVHAIGESINIASRLQAAAVPNALVISNRLRSRYFGARDDFEERGILPLKNIGEVIAWQKCYT